VSKLRAFEGNDRFCSRAKALRDAFGFFPCKSDGEGPSAYFDKIRAMLPRISRAVGGTVEELDDREMLRNGLFYDLVYYRVKETGLPVLVHALQRKGAVPDDIFDSPYYEGDKAIVALVLPAEMKDRSVWHVFIISDDVKACKLAYTEELRAPYVRRGRACFDREFSFYWQNGCDAEQEEFLAEVLREPVGSEPAPPPENIKRLLRCKATDAEERKIVLASVGICGVV
jgi:hypothetical protein